MVFAQGWVRLRPSSSRSLPSDLKGARSGPRSLAFEMDLLSLSPFDHSKVLAKDC